jgi:hypothetical protein
MKQSTLKKNWLLLLRFYVGPDEYIKQWCIDDPEYYGNFHEDYLYIMPIVDKIESLCESKRHLGKTNIYEVIINGNSCCIRHRRPPHTWDFEVEKTGKTKVEAIYKACVEFVKFYNRQNRLWK